MLAKRSKLKIALTSILIVVLLVSGYFYLPDILGDQVFPLKYQDNIKKWCTAYNEDPFLVAAIIMQESGFSPDAESSTGARGLMQIAPTTAKGIASGVEYPNYSVDKLYDPDVSIQFGTWYIHVLKEKYNGNITAALAAYNAGTGNADKWIRAGLLNSPSDNNYAYKVQNYMAVYQKIYPNELSLTASAKPSSEIKLEQNSGANKNFVWGQMLKQLVSVYYGIKQ